MKKFFFSMLLSICSILSLSAMSYEEARDQARFLTDKMAYELNLNDAQYNDCYEINLDYLMSVQTADDIYGSYLTYRNADLRHILYDWQYSLFVAADYFFHPLSWYRGAWYYPIYRHYAVGHFYYGHPAIFYSYRGGHGRFHHHGGFYASRRPHWNGGFRGSSRGSISPRGGAVRPHHGGSSHHTVASSRPGSITSRPGSAGHRGGGYSIGGQRGGGSYNHPSSTRTTVNAGHGSHHGSGSGSHSMSTSPRGGGSTRGGGFSGGSRGGGSHGGGFNGATRGGGTRGGRGH